MESAPKSVWAVVVAGGSGTRFGTLKQYEQLGDRRVVDWALVSARTIADGVVLVGAGEFKHGLQVASIPRVVCSACYVDVGLRHRSPSISLR